VWILVAELREIPLSEPLERPKQSARLLPNDTSEHLYT
jgi:hypothetical protein